MAFKPRRCASRELCRCRIRLRRSSSGRTRTSSCRWSTGLCAVPALATRTAPPHLALSSDRVKWPGGIFGYRPIPQRFCRLKMRSKEGQRPPGHRGCGCVRLLCPSIQYAWMHLNAGPLGTQNCSAVRLSRAYDAAYLISNFRNARPVPSPEIVPLATN